MNRGINNPDNYRTSKWVNQCSICGDRGYNPEVPEDTGYSVRAKHMKRYLKPLYVNEFNICQLCEELTNLK